MHSFDPALARKLILDELFDLSLYRALHAKTSGHLQDLLADLVKIESKHLAFWQEFFGMPELNRLGLVRRLRLALLSFLVTVFGERAVHLILESIEVYGVRKYLHVWEQYQGTPLADATKRVLEDELHHEDVLVSERIERRIDAERIRNIFLGFNDGLVETLGAVSGFFAAFANSTSVLAAAFTVAVAGAISMAAGVYVSSGSEAEVTNMEIRKAKFLGKGSGAATNEESPLGAAFTVGVSYFLGALVPVLPVLIGANNVVASAVASGIMIIAISFVLSFLSGMDIRRRIAINLIVIGVALTVTYLIGTAARSVLGIAI